MKLLDVFSKTELAVILLSGLSMPSTGVLTLDIILSVAAANLAAWTILWTKYGWWL